MEAASACLDPEVEARQGTAIRLDNVEKGFDGVPVLRNITVGFRPGTVNVLAGENGAGKSTLFRIISGQHAPDSGALYLHGDLVRTYSPRHAQTLGVSIIPQELAPIPDMRLWQNLLVGHESVSLGGFLRRRAMIEQAAAMLRGVGMTLDPETPMKELGVAETQMVEILKATSWDSRIVLMDEPSSSLSSRETEQLFKVIAMLRAKGACILYTSHRMEEIEQISDTVAIMRDGHIVSHEATGSQTEHQIIAAMVGRELTELFPNRVMAPAGSPVVLSVRDMTVRGYDACVSLDVRAGEILGLGGLVGAGRSELLEAIFGTRAGTGHVTIDGQPVRSGSPSAAIRAGMAMVPEDRKHAGVLTAMSIMDNVTLPYLDRFEVGAGFLSPARRREQTEKILLATRVACTGPLQKVAHLSGGNQQKVALARWLVGKKPRLLILDEPTRGIDVGARSELYRLFNELAAEGVAILLASSDMPELINLSHRVLVLRGGAIMGELSKEELDQEKILRLAMGKTSNVAH
ncbi:sugar ABC transporter ATP-binding protein [Ameyamaea chiangmaiensis]|uniref:Sugar ABC transporter ATP-binding protein n=2 Tax=Ameyamaea chiangmaiensis TaxID=442969 RepID=A0A850PE13_9PROT|nr:sugar ABC transporter ATP-binding protein [Ameyamaea chiangmaiensis]